jgi:hypothetical protein
VQNLALTQPIHTEQNCAQKENCPDVRNPKRLRRIQAEQHPQQIQKNPIGSNCAQTMNFPNEENPKRMLPNHNGRNYELTKNCQNERNQEPTCWTPIGLRQKETTKNQV